MSFETPAIESTQPLTDEEVIAKLQDWKGPLVDFARQHKVMPRKVYNLRAKMRKVKEKSTTRSLQKAGGDQSGFAVASVQQGTSRSLSQQHKAPTEPERHPPAVCLRLGTELAVDFFEAPQACYLAALARRLQC